MARILIVEDEPDIAYGLQEDLGRHGHDTQVAADGEAALAVSSAVPWDLILLDVMLPKLDGFEVCQELRRRGVRCPVIFLTAKTLEAEKLLGFELGADDYVTKPFSPRELRARIKARLRNAGEHSSPARRFGDCEVDFQRAELRRGGRPVELTATELRLLRVFLERVGRVLTRQQLIDAAWEPGTFITDRVVDTHVWSLRKKIEPDPAEPRFLRSIRGSGYRFDL
jgi:DNA-binding response OmpR family regulator